MPLFRVALAALALSGAGAATALSGGSIAGLLWCWACAAAAVGGPALLAAQLCCGALPAPLRAPAGLAWSLAAFAVLTMACGAMGRRWPLRLWGACGALALAAALAGRLRQGRLWRRAGSPFAALRRGLPLAAAWAFLVLVSALGAARFAHPSAVGVVCPDQDFFWNLGNVKSLMAGFPPQDLRFFGLTLTYHYLTELLAAGLALLSGLPAYDLLAFYQTPLVLALVLWLLWRLGAAAFGGQRGKQLALALCPFFMGCASLYKAWPEGDSRFWNLSIRHLLTNINGQATATVFLTLFTLLFQQLCAGRFAPGRAGRQAAVAALLALACLGLAKGPAAGIAALAALCCCLLFALFPRLCGSAAALPGAGAGPGEGPGLGTGPEKKTGPGAVETPGRGESPKPPQQPGSGGKPAPPGGAQGCRRGAALLFGLAALGVFLLLYRLFFAAGAGASMKLDPMGTVGKSYFANIAALVGRQLPGAAGLTAPLFWLAQAFCFAPAAFGLAAWGFFDRLAGRRPPGPGRLFWAAGAAGGFLAFFLFDHYAMSQVYFGFTGLFFLNLLAVDQLGALGALLRPAAGRGRRLLAAVAAVLCGVSLCTGCLMQLALARSGAALLAGPQAAAAQGAARHGAEYLSAEEEAGMALLAALQQPGELFATNRIHTGRAQEGLSNLYSGLSGCGAYMESFKYAMSNMGAPVQEVQLRVGQVSALFDPAAEPGQLLAFCAGHRVRYIAYCPRFFGTDAVLAGSPAFEKVYESAELTLYRALW